MIQDARERDADVFVMQWLTQGRNSCPLCRGQGVDEKEKAADDVPAESSAVA